MLIKNYFSINITYLFIKLHQLGELHNTAIALACKSMNNETCKA